MQEKAFVSVITVYKCFYITFIKKKILEISITDVIFKVKSVSFEVLHMQILRICFVLVDFGQMHHLRIIFFFFYWKTIFFIRRFFSTTVFVRLLYRDRSYGINYDGQHSRWFSTTHLITTQFHHIMYYTQLCSTNKCVSSITASKNESSKCKALRWFYWHLTL